MAESGTVEEIDQFVAAGKPAMLYFSRRPIDPNKIDADQQSKLRKFQETTFKRALVGHFSSLDELRQILLRDLMHQVRSLKSSDQIHNENDARARERRDESLERSQEVFKNHQHLLRDPCVQLLIGPKFEYKEIVTREELFSFVKSTSSRNYAIPSEDRYDFHLHTDALFGGATVRFYQGGTYCVKEAIKFDPYRQRDSRTMTARFISFGQFGLIRTQIAFPAHTIFTGVNPGGGPAGETRGYFFWDIVFYLKHLLLWATTFYETFPPGRELLLKVGLANLWQEPFKLTHEIGPLTKAIGREASTEDIQCQADNFEAQVYGLISKVCYQLLWNFGGEQPPTDNLVKQLVDHYWKEK